MPKKFYINYLTGGSINETPVETPLKKKSNMYVKELVKELLTLEKETKGTVTGITIKPFKVKHYSFDDFRKLFIKYVIIPKNVISGKVSVNSPVEEIYQEEKKKPSIEYCETGKLAEGEDYDQKIHKMGETPYQRCYDFYPTNYPEKNKVRDKFFVNDITDSKIFKECKFYTDEYLDFKKIDLQKFYNNFSTFAFSILVDPIVDVTPHYDYINCLKMFNFLQKKTKWTNLSENMTESEFVKLFHDGGKIDTIKELSESYKLFDTEKYPKTTGKPMFFAGLQNIEFDSYDPLNNTFNKVFFTTPGYFVNAKTAQTLDMTSEYTINNGERDLTVNFDNRMSLPFADYEITNGGGKGDTNTL